MDEMHRHIIEQGVTEEVRPLVEEREGKKVVKAALHAQVSYRVLGLFVHHGDS